MIVNLFRVKIAATCSEWDRTALCPADQFLLVLGTTAGSAALYEFVEQNLELFGAVVSHVFSNYRLECDKACNGVKLALERCFAAPQAKARDLFGIVFRVHPQSLENLFPYRKLTCGFFTDLTR